MRNLATRLSVLVTASVLCTTAQSQITNQDDCANSGVDNVGPGTHAFDTTNATTGAEGQADCLAFGSTVVDQDIWFTYTAATSGNATLSTCSASGTHTDTKIVAWPSSPACPTAGSMIACNDDACGFFSEFSFPVGAGGSYVIQLGSFPGAAGGTGELDITEGPSAPCVGVSTLYASNNGGSVGGAVYFNLEAAASINISAIETNYSAAVGTPVGLEIYTTGGTYVGNENSPGAWVLLGSGIGASAGTNNPTHIDLMSPVTLNVGSVGVALVAVGSGHRYTNGDGTPVPGSGTNQFYSDGTVSLSLGAATNIPFTGNIFQPRVWNGQLCYGVLGTNYCGPAVPNSTGAPGIISASGSPLAGSNALALLADQLPPAQFGYFLASQNQGFFSPPNSQGFVCLGAGIGRFNQPGLVGQGPTFSIMPDLNSIPTNPPAAVQPGDTWNFQCWYRDVGNTNNFTDAVEILFQ